MTLFHYHLCSSHDEFYIKCTLLQSLIELFSSHDEFYIKCTPLQSLIELFSSLRDRTKIPLCLCLRLVIGSTKMFACIFSKMKMQRLQDRKKIRSIRGPPMCSIVRTTSSGSSENSTVAFQC